MLTDKKRKPHNISAVGLLVKAIRAKPTFHLLELRTEIEEFGDERVIGIPERMRVTCYD